MTLDATEVYATDHEGAWIVCDLREPDSVRCVHELRAFFREHSDLAALGPEHLVVVITPERAA